MILLLGKFLRVVLLILEIIKDEQFKFKIFIILLELKILFINASLILNFYNF